MPRKIVLIITSCMILLALAGCGAKSAPKTDVTGTTPQTDVTDSKTKTNFIGPKPLTEDQQEIVDLLQGDSKQEITIFSYDADAEYTDFEAWVEIYKDGELITPHAGGIHMMSPLDHFQGDLAIAITQKPDFQWTFIAKEGGTIVSHTSDPAPHMDTMARAFGPIPDPVVIEDGKEIILYTSVFSSDNVLNSYDSHTLEEKPERLKEYDYAHIIKCRFSK
jgi:hypothetical protein